MKRNGGEKKPKVSAVRERQRAPSVLAREEGISLPQRELLAFISAISDLIGPQTGRLREIWLDELACMDHTPQSSSDWQLVTLAASRRLALRLIAMHLN